MPSAVRSLEELLSPETKPEVRLRAARHVLRLAGMRPGDLELVQREGPVAPDAEIEAILERLRCERSLKVSNRSADEEPESKVRIGPANAGQQPGPSQDINESSPI